MKKFFLIVSIFLFFSPSSVYAATIKNLDDKAYSLIVKQKDKIFQLNIDPNGIIKDLCDFCTIEVVGFSLTDIENEDDLFIKDGNLSLKEE